MSRKISIKGTGKVSVKVDYIQIRIIIEGKNKNCEKAVSEAAELVSILEKNLLKAGFEKNLLRTENYGLQKNYSYIPNKKGSPERKDNGFICRHVLKLEFDFENKKLTDAVSAITNCVAESKMEVLFTVKDKEAVNKQLLSSVAGNAKQKAEILCSAAGSKLGQLISIDYNWEERELFSNSKFLGDTTQLPHFANEQLQPMMISEEIDIRPENITISDSAMFVWEII